MIMFPKLQRGRYIDLSGDPVGIGIGDGVCQCETCLSAQYLLNQ